MDITCIRLLAVHRNLPALNRMMCWRAATAYSWRRLVFVVRPRDINNATREAFRFKTPATSLLDYCPSDERSRVRMSDANGALNLVLVQFQKDKQKIKASKVRGDGGVEAGVVEKVNA